MRLNSLFDVLRGWPKEGAIDDVFPVHVTSSVFDSLPSGTVVTQQSDGTMAAATSPGSGADAISTWVVVEGNDDFSGTFLEKVNCLRSNCVLKLDPSNYAAGAYTPGTLMSFSAGKFKVAATTEQVIAECQINNSASDHTLVVFYHGGTAKKV